MTGTDENARKQRRAAHRGPAVDEPKRLNRVALHRRRLILDKAMLQRRQQEQVLSAQRVARWAFWATVVAVAAIAAGNFASFTR
jgi:hypothetical protein